MLAAVFALFHILTVVSALISTGGSGEGQAFTVVFLDAPLVLLLRVVPGGGFILYNSDTAYIWFFCIAGTLMYGFVGLGLGLLFSKLRGLISAKSSD
jgi:fumarate reductase subunit C